MGGLLGQLPVGPISAGAFAIAICWWVTRLVLTGKLVTRQQLMDVQADRDHWRAAADEWQKVASQHGMSLEKLLEYAATSNEVLTKMQATVPQARTGRERT